MKKYTIELLDWWCQQEAYITRRDLHNLSPASHLHTVMWFAARWICDLREYRLDSSRCLRPGYSIRSSCIQLHLEIWAAWHCLLNKTMCILLFAAINLHPLVLSCACRIEDQDDERWGSIICGSWDWEWRSIVNTIYKSNYNYSNI